MTRARHRIDDLHVCVTSPVGDRGYLLFVHGGPGSHAAYFERALETLPPYVNAGFGWITYDQRGCGRSGRSAEPITHATNLADLAKVLTTLKNDHDIVPRAIVGHSYGASLLYDYVMMGGSPGMPTVLVALAKDRGFNRYRALTMDLVLLKRDAPDVYRSLYPQLAQAAEPWDLANQVRDAMPNIDGRKHFYWANLDVRDWYEALKTTVGVPESNEVFREVRTSLWTSPSALSPMEAATFPNPLLWINGWHDFLMGGRACEDPLLFTGSAHYPHLEEPEKFLAAIDRFLTA